MRVNNEVTEDQNPKRLDLNHSDSTSLNKCSDGSHRQVIRQQLMQQAEILIRRLKTIIGKSTLGLARPRIYVHIISGLTGGTGSGCFLDVCYILRSILKYYDNVQILGYFFMPDIFIEDFHKETHVLEHLASTGYAAMQELDYCMNLPGNGGSFSQNYGNVVITWDKPPVDLPFLICGTNERGDRYKHPLEYGISTVTEYMMRFLMKSTEGSSMDAFLCNCSAQMSVINAEKNFGASTSYFTIGASSVKIHSREIYTYLASELFHQFSDLTDKPSTNSEAEDFMLRIFGLATTNTETLYQHLYDRLISGVTSNYSHFPGDYRDLSQRDDNILFRCYHEQNAKNESIVEINAKHMVNSTVVDLETMKMHNGENSLLDGLMNVLLSEVKCGPVYVLESICTKENTNILNIIDGLLAENDKRQQQKTDFLKCLRNEVSKIQSDFFSATLFIKRKKLFKSYEDALQNLFYCEFECFVCQKINETFKHFRFQIENIVEPYFKRFESMFRNLIETFEENRQLLLNADFLSETNITVSPIVTIKDVKSFVDEEIKGIKLGHVWEIFSMRLLKQYKIWYKNHEKELARYITNFVYEIFPRFTAKTMTDILRDKYADRFYKNGIEPLLNHTSPAFDRNMEIPVASESLKFLCCPENSLLMQLAAKKAVETHRYLWHVRKTPETGCITAIVIKFGIPLFAYKMTEKYEQYYFTNNIFGNSSYGFGLHLYESNDNDPLMFNDWRKLPPITPYSCLDNKKLPVNLQILLKESEELYEKVRRYRMISEDGQLFRPDPNDIRTILEICNSVEKDIACNADGTVIFDKIQYLEGITANGIGMIATGDHLPCDGTIGKPEIQKDYFIGYPAIHAELKAHIEHIEGVIFRAEDIIEKFYRMYPEKEEAIEESPELIAFLESLKIKDEKKIDIISDSETKDGIDNVTIEPYEGSEPYAFVSYSHSDLGKAQPIIRLLIEKGINVWFDKGINPGNEWPDEIQTHLEHCSVFLPLISDAYCNSLNCRNELSFAIGDHIETVPVFIAESKLENGVKVQIASFQHINQYMIEDQDVFFALLMKANGMRFFADKPEPFVKQISAAPIVESNRIFFGRYPQKNCTDEPVEWIVVKQDKEKILILSRYLLVVKPFDAQRQDLSWCKSDIRSWLNNYFLDRAFNDDEKERIINSCICNPEGETKDYVFLLSKEEAVSLFDTSKDRKASPTFYARLHGLETETCCWWLRSHNGENGAFVDETGRICKPKTPILINRTYIRPCMRILNIDKTLEIGSTFRFGAYYQDDELNRFGLEWIVLDVQEKETLVITKKAIQFSKYASNPWADSDLRKWLNNDFIRNCFSPKERELILATTHADSGNKNYQTISQESVDDRVYCLSIEEAQHYFSDDAQRIAEPTAFALSTDEHRNRYTWWLRSLIKGKDEFTVCFVNENGELLGHGFYPNLKTVYIRPAMYIRK